MARYRGCVYRTIYPFDRKITEKTWIVFQAGNEDLEILKRRHVVRIRVGTTRIDPDSSGISVDISIGQYLFCYQTP